MAAQEELGPVLCVIQSLCVNQIPGDGIAGMLVFGSMSASFQTMSQEMTVMSLEILSFHK